MNHQGKKEKKHDRRVSVSFIIFVPFHYLPLLISFIDLPTLFFRGKDKDTAWIDHYTIKIVIIVIILLLSYYYVCIIDGCWLHKSFF